MLPAPPPPSAAEVHAWLAELRDLRIRLDEMHNLPTKAIQRLRRGSYEVQRGDHDVEIHATQYVTALERVLRVLAIMFDEGSDQNENGGERESEGGTGTWTPSGTRGDVSRWLHTRAQQAASSS